MLLKGGAIRLTQKMTSTARPHNATSQSELAFRPTAYAQPLMGNRVDVVRSGEWWAITVPSLRGVFSQAKHLDEVPAVAREAIAMMLDVDPADVGSIDVRVRNAR